MICEGVESCLFPLGAVTFRRFVVLEVTVLEVIVLEVNLLEVIVLEVNLLEVNLLEVNLLATSVFRVARSPLWFRCRVPGHRAPSRGPNPIA